MPDQNRAQRLTPERVLVALEQASGSVPEAAEALGVHWVSLYRFMREQGIRIEHDRRVVAP